MASSRLCFSSTLVRQYVVQSNRRIRQTCNRKLAGFPTAGRSILLVRLWDTSDACRFSRIVLPLIICRMVEHLVICKHCEQHHNCASNANDYVLTWFISLDKQKPQSLPTALLIDIKASPRIVGNNTSNHTLRHDSASSLSMVPSISLDFLSKRVRMLE